MNLWRNVFFTKVLYFPTILMCTLL